MNIQLSVVLWTIICFVLLMLILHNLLFKPVLKVLDARREKIENAAAKKVEWEKAGQEHVAMLAEREEQFARERQQQIREAVETIHQDSKRTVELAKEARMELVDSYRGYVEAEREAIMRRLSVHSSELATAFADRLTKE